MQDFASEDTRLWHWPAYMLHFVDRRHQPTMPVMINLGPGVGIVIDQTVAKNRDSYRSMMRYKGRKVVFGDPTQQSWKRVDSLDINPHLLDILFRSMATVADDQRIIGWYSDITRHDYNFWLYEDVQRIGRG